LLSAFAVGSQIPTTLSEIPDPVIRSLMQMLAILLAILASVKVDLREVGRGSEYPRLRP
jgi:hypothetical protein